MGMYELHEVTTITGISDAHNAMKYDMDFLCEEHNTMSLVREVVLILGVGIRSRKIS
jgi:hypothetical protein